MSTTTTAAPASSSSWARYQEEEGFRDFNALEMYFRGSGSDDAFLHARAGESAIGYGDGEVSFGGRRRLVRAEEFVIGLGVWLRETARATEARNLSFEMWAAPILADDNRREPE